MTKEYFILADPHLSHKNIIEYCNRPFSSVEEMDQKLIDNWNSVVKPNYTVYVLGDVCMKKQALPLLEQMNGRKILVPGNHDIFEAKTYLKYFDDVRGYIVKDNIIFSHIPIHKSSIERFTGCVHGHLHTGRVMDGLNIDPFYYCVSVEHINYTPMLLSEVITKLKEQQNEK